MEVEKDNNEMEVAPKNKDELLGVGDVEPEHTQQHQLPLPLPPPTTTKGIYRQKKVQAT
jgi:hypothetical protein